ncbi:MAG TPA: drug/metabolite exporter YedA [Gemmatimonadaceae bacterium]|nr:drug/metabolite exporter YedA [Gemmatimonadaceae bacterium]
MADSPQHAHPSTVKIVAAFAAVYLIWGSTYLAIRFAIDTIPPFAMAGLRQFIAGFVLYIWMRSHGAERPTIAQWRSATIVGALLLVGGNGAVVWAEQRVASGPASLIVAMVPLWMVVFEWARPRGVRPSAWVLAGIALGLAGIALLVGPGTFAGGEPIDHIGAAVLVLGSLSWAEGSLYSRRAKLPSSPLLGTSMQLLGGGVLLILIATLTGEWHAMAPGAVSIKSMSALLYLVIFGSLVGFTCYIWLLRVSTPARVSTYAYVNPVVAVILGWAFAGEPLTARTALAAATIIGAVALITVGQRTGPGARGPRWRERVTGRIRSRGVPIGR